MRITTWNVNGLRAVMTKKSWQWVAESQPDVLCLQEIKARPDQLAAEHLARFEGYQAYWNPAQRPGYSGVATFTRRLPLEVSMGIADDEFDIEGRVIRTVFPGFTLFNVYFPSGQRGYGRVEFKLRFYACLLDICDRMHVRGEKLVICGDFNTAHQEIDLRNPKSNQKTSGFLPEERAWVTRYLSQGFVDAFRALYPEKVQYTWWTYVSGARTRNVGWRLDYFLVSKALMPSVRDVIVHEDVTGSDHCPVTLDIDESQA